MKTVFVIGAILTGLLLFSTVVCGLWLRAHQPVDPSSLQFHMVIGLATAGATAAPRIQGAILADRPACARIADSISQ
jgi:hypothetical protein